MRTQHWIMTLGLVLLLFSLGCNERVPTTTAPNHSSDSSVYPSFSGESPLDSHASGDRPAISANVLLNGSFESALPPWSVATTNAPFRPWNITGAGQGGGFGMDTTSPFDGANVIWNGFDGNGPMEFRLWQDVALPAGQPAELAWSEKIQWNFTLGGNATLARTFEVQLRDPGDESVLETLYTFSTGTQATNPTGNTGWQSHAADVSSHAGSTVRVTFVATIPQAGTGPGQLEIDAVSLNSGFSTVTETLYAGVSRGSSLNRGALLTLDQDTAAATLVGDVIASTSGGLTGLAFDSQNRLWGSSIDGPNGNRVSRLVQIDPANAGLLADVAILYQGTPISIGDLAVQPGTDVIFGIRSNADAVALPGGLLFTIAPDGTATLIGDTGQNRGGGLAFAPDGTLYYLEFNELHVLDPTDASILSTTVLNYGGHDGLGIRPSDGRLFASQAGTNTDGTIRIINPAAGTSTVLGNSGLGAVSDLAFRVESAIGIDIRPGSLRNPVNLRSRGVIPVAILTTDSFDATQVDASSLAFGPAGAGIAHASGHLTDIDNDGDTDLLVHFRTQDTGISEGDTEACLSGMTLGGDPFSACDGINLVPDVVTP